MLLKKATEVQGVVIADDSGYLRYVIVGCFQQTNSVVHAKSINDIENHNNIGYIIDVNGLKPNIHGIVYCIQKRNIFDVLIIPDNNYTLTEAALKTLKSFMYSEYLEYVKFYEQ